MLAPWACEDSSDDDREEDTCRLDEGSMSGDHSNESLSFKSSPPGHMRVFLLLHPQTLNKGLFS